jgi:hypothetical protein
VALCEKVRLTASFGRGSLSAIHAINRFPTRDARKF